MYKCIQVAKELDACNEEKMGKKRRDCKIAIIDADLIGRTRHRFPNLACEKIAGYYKEKGAKVVLKLDYDNLDEYDHTFISKVFTDTPFPESIKASKRIHFGGTGFYFDKAPELIDEIEYHMPDYHLYDNWIEEEVKRGRENAAKQQKPFNEKSFRSQFKEYTDYSIGFLTRGCFRKCEFCVNRKYDRVFRAGSLADFYDSERRKLCFLDDNFFGGGPRIWRPLLEEVMETGKPFKFKQGLDERLLTDEICSILFNSNYDGDFTFAFDNIKDYDLIHRQLERIRKYTNDKNIKFYVLVGFESVDATDIENAFKRIELLMRYQCHPYIMRYKSEHDSPWEASKYRSLYIQLARWCNQPSFFKKKSFRQYCEANQERVKTERMCVAMKALIDFEKEHPEIAKKYFDMRYDDYQ